MSTFGPQVEVAVARVRAEVSRLHAELTRYGLVVWTGGNDRLWDRLTVDSLGSFDLLKTVSSHPRIGYGRRNRRARHRRGGGHRSRQPQVVRRARALIRHTTTR